MRAKVTIDRINELLSDTGDIVISEQYKWDIPIDILCSTCDLIYSKQYCSILNGQRCLHCQKNKQPFKSNRLGFKFVSNYIKQSGDILISDKYVNGTTKLDFICGKANHTFSMNWTNYQQGQRCRYCNNDNLSEQRRTTIEDINKYIESRGATLIDGGNDYKNVYSRITIKCNTCEYISSLLYISYKLSNGCSSCNQKKYSKGEQHIAEYLKNHNITYIAQATFEGCKSKYLLKFDFYLPEHNLCIEYDGMQHYEPVEYFGGQKGFESSQIRDEIKNTYCRNNNINLVRIRYDEKNINGVLDKLFNIERIDEIINSD